MLAAVLVVLVPPTSRAADATWTRVGTGILEGVSGAAVNPQGGWVIVRDNKLAGQNRVALLSAGGGLYLQLRGRGASLAVGPGGPALRVEY